MRQMLTTLVMIGGLSLGLSASAQAAAGHNGASHMSGGVSTRASAAVGGGNPVTPVPIVRSIAPTPEPFGGGSSGTSIYDEPPASWLSCAEIGGRMVAGPTGIACR